LIVFLITKHAGHPALPSPSTQPTRGAIQVESSHDVVLTTLADVVADAAVVDVTGGVDVKLAQAASVTASTTIPITPNLRTVIIVPPINLPGTSGEGNT
jgi:hypothetical protein